MPLVPTTVQSAKKTKWFHPSRPRLIAAAIVSLALLILQPHSWPFEPRIMNAWSGAAASYLIFTWIFMVRCNAEQTRHLSTREDEARFTVDMLLVLGCLASIGEVILTLGLAGHAKRPLVFWLTGAALISFALSWTLLHTIYALHYARLYYREGDGSGVDFHTKDAPDYLDFCYLAFAIGVTFGTTDTDIGGRVFRRTILKHSLLSFFFATIIVGLSINVIASWL
jgi:uncharacterized membrane protein